MSRPRRTSKAPTRFDEVEREEGTAPATKRAKRGAGTKKKNHPKPPTLSASSSSNMGMDSSRRTDAAGVGAAGSLAAAVAASPATMTASDREAVLSLLGIATTPKRSPPGRELFPKGAAAAAAVVGAGGGYGGSPGDGSRKRDAGGAAGAGAVARPVKLHKSAINTPRKGTKGKEGKNTPKGAKTPKTPKSAAKPRGRAGGRGTPGSGTPRGGRAGSAVVPITKQMVDLSVQLGKLVRNPLALKWCSYEHFYSSLDRYVTTHLLQQRRLPPPLLPRALPAAARLPFYAPLFSRTMPKSLSPPLPLL